MTKSVFFGVCVCVCYCRYGKLQRGDWLPPCSALESPLCAVPCQTQSVGPLSR